MLAQSKLTYVCADISDSGKLIKYCKHDDPLDCAPSNQFIIKKLCDLDLKQTDIPNRALFSGVDKSECVPITADLIPLFRAMTLPAW
jgi:hypothetical protein